MRAALCLLTALALSSCVVIVDADDDDVERRTVEGSGVGDTEIRRLDGFGEVTFASPGDLFVDFGARESIRLEADDNLLQYIETYVRRGVLQIEVEEGVTLRPERPIRVYLTVRQIDAVTTAGSGNVEMNAFTGESLKLASVGSGDVWVGDAAADRLEVELMGSGDVDVAGAVAALDATIAGSGDLVAPDLTATTAHVSIIGSGSAEVRVQDALEVTIAGSGSVHYFGDPTVDATIIGTGRVIREGD